VRIDQGASLGRPSRLIASALVTANGVARSRVSGTASVQRRERLHLEELKAQGDSPVSELR
jgi:predicted PhzF superfamily epimerase YddE/YHI9